MKDLKLKNDTAYVEARNELVVYVNKVVPLLIERLAKGYKIKASGDELFKKEANELKEIIEFNKSSRISAFFRVSEQSIYLSVRTCSLVDWNDKNGVMGSRYITKEIYLASPISNHLNDSFKPLEKITVKQLHDAEAKLEKLETQASKIRSEISDIKYFLDI